MVPDPSYKKSALQQVGEVVFGLSNEGLAEFRRIWIKVSANKASENPNRWKFYMPPVHGYYFNNYEEIDADLNLHISSSKIHKTLRLVVS